MKIFHSFDKDSESLFCIFSIISIPDVCSGFSVLSGSRRGAFCGIADDGFLDATDLEQSFGRGADVKQMIAAADKNGDGKVRLSG